MTKLEKRLLVKGCKKCKGTSVNPKKKNTSCLACNGSGLEKLNFGLSSSGLNDTADFVLDIKEARRLVKALSNPYTQREYLIQFKECLTDHIEGSTE